METSYRIGDDDAYLNAEKREILGPKEVVGPHKFDADPYDNYNTPDIAAQTDSEDAEPKTYDDIYSRSSSITRFDDDGALDGG